MHKRIFDPSKEELEKLYELHTTAEIGAQFNVNPETVRKRLHEHGITPRQNGVRSRKPRPPREELAALYQELSMKQIARKLHVGETLVWKWLKHYDIKLRGYEDGGHRKKPGRQFSQEHRQNLSRAHRGRWAGEKNPNWKGGVHDEHMRIRRSGEYKQWKMAALERAGHQCEECGVRQDTVCVCCGTKIRLHVHHIKSFAKHPDLRFDPKNSEVLCPKCHNTSHNGETG